MLKNEKWCGKSDTSQQFCEALRDAWPGFIILWELQSEDLLFIFLNDKKQPGKKMDEETNFGEAAVIDRTHNSGGYLRAGKCFIIR